MPEKITIQTITGKNKPALRINMQTMNAAGGVLSLSTLNGSLLRLIALPDGETVIELEKIDQPGIYIKIETAHHTLLRKIDIPITEQQISI